MSANLKMFGSQVAIDPEQIIGIEAKMNSSVAYVEITTPYGVFECPGIRLAEAFAIANAHVPPSESTGEL